MSVKSGSYCCHGHHQEVKLRASNLSTEWRSSDQILSMLNTKFHAPTVNNTIEVKMSWAGKNVPLATPTSQPG